MKRLTAPLFANKSCGLWKVVSTLLPVLLVVAAFATPRLAEAEPAASNPTSGRVWLSKVLPASSTFTAIVRRRSTVAAIRLRFRGKFAAAEVVDSTGRLVLWVLASHHPDAVIGESGFQPGAAHSAEATYTPATPVALQPGEYRMNVVTDRAVSVDLQGSGSARPPTTSVVREQSADAAVERSQGGQGVLRMGRSNLTLPRRFHLLLQMADFSRVNDEAGYESMCLTAPNQYCESPPDPTIGTWWVTPNPLNNDAEETVVAAYKPGELSPGQYSAVAEMASAATGSTVLSLAVCLP